MGHAVFSLVCIICHQLGTTQWQMRCLFVRPFLCLCWASNMLFLIGRRQTLSDVIAFLLLILEFCCSLGSKDVLFVAIVLLKSSCGSLSFVVCCLVNPSPLNGALAFLWKVNILNNGWFSMDG